MADQGLCYFPGIQQVVSASMTIGHGITPGVCTLQIAPQAEIVQTQGTLRFWMGSTVIEFPDCLVASGSYTRDTSSGMIVSLQIMDRRWKWAYGKLAGMYNVRRIDGKLVGGGNGLGASLARNTEKSPQDLAKLCFQAIGETGYDVSGLPNDARPFVEWDVVNPMQALADLCELLGCRIVLGLDNRVRIFRRGQGAELPWDNSVMDDSGTIDPPDEIKTITVVTGKCLFQQDFALEPVGEDVDGSIKPLNKISYLTSANLEEADLGSFNGIQDPKCRELAQKSFYKWYRVVAPLNLQGYGPVNDLELLGLTSEQVTTTADYDSDGRLLPDRQREALVYGDYFQKDGDYRNTGTTTLPQNPTKDELKYVIQGVSVNTDTGVVEFGEPIYRLVGNGLAPATLKLRTSTYVRQEKDWAWVRWAQSRGSGHPEKLIHRDEIVLAFRNGTSNRKEVDQQTNYYIDAAIKELYGQQPQSRSYAGLKWIQLDGAIQQVSFEVGMGGCKTRAARCNDVDTSVPTYEERRFYERIRGQKPQKTDRQIKAVK